VGRDVWILSWLKVGAPPVTYRATRQKCLLCSCRYEACHI
jgi:hypothetical protein